MYNRIGCPTCGNETVAKSTKEPQKCKWCRRLFKVKVTRRNKEGKKGKFDWSTEPVDFPDENRFGTRSLANYENDDVYGASDSWNGEDFDGDK